MNLKTRLMSLVAAAAMFAGSASAAQTPSAQVLSQTLSKAMIAVSILEGHLVTQNLLNWQVGEWHTNDVKLSLPFPGKGDKSVTKDVPDRNAFWYVNNMEIFGQKQTTESLMSRANGEVLELIVNGKKQDLNKDEQKLEILEQYETEVTVPAGKFDCMYVKAKVTSGSETQEIQVWINPVDVNLDGMLKVVVQSQLGPVELLLKAFGKK